MSQRTPEASVPEPTPDPEWDPPEVHQGIRRRFVVAISMLIALVLVTQGSALLLFGHDLLQRHLEEEAESYATLAAAPISEAYRTYHGSGHSKFRQLVEATTSLQPDLARIAIYDMEGRRLFATDDAEDAAGGGDADDGGDAVPGSIVRADESLLSAIRSLESTSWRVEISDRDALFVVVQPHVEEWGRHQYSVVFSFSYDRVRRTLVIAGLWLGTIALIALGLGVGCAYVLSAQSLRPLDALTRHARALARGRLDRRLALRSDDEFAVLGDTLDRMAELLESTIDDLEASNRRLERANRELQELDRVKSDLLANVSHELRTPLTAISGYVEVMGSGLLGEVDATQKDALVVVDRNIARLRSMIDQLLGYSRMESGRLEIESRAFDLEPVCRHVVEVLRAARAGEIGFEVVVEPLDAAIGLPEVFGDPARISQVLENLLTNAAKFSPDGGLVTLRLRELPDDVPGTSGVEIAVSDRGIGIPDEARERIFDRFYQIDASSKRQYGGMGLGLAIVREIVEQHHAQVEVDSAVGEGSTFRFVLPFAADRSTSVVAVGGGRRLLVVDDDSSFVQRLASHLGSRGWLVHVAATAEQGSILARRTSPDVVLIDRLLPDLDGFDLMTRLLGDDGLEGVPIVLCTIRRERSLGLRLGASDYWIKPITPEEVEEGLEEVLETAAARDASPGDGLSAAEDRDTVDV